MSRETIEKQDKLYAFLRHYVDASFRFYFKTTIANIDNLPLDKPIILAPNHQNALMDALAILTIKKWQPVFLARSDIFKKPLLEKLLTFFKILPVYRIRDGYSTLQKNDAIFNKTIDVIKSRTPLVILPEGNHGEQKNLRQLKKGICRIAFQTEEANDFNLDIKIIPVGLDYSNYQKMGSKLLINIGEPISLSDFYDDYKESPNKGYLKLIKHLGDKMKDVMINIESEDYYDMYITLIEIYRPQMIERLNLKNTSYNQFLADQKTVKLLNDNREKLNFEELSNQTEQYDKLLNKKKFRNWLFEKQQYSLAGSLLGFIAQLITLPLFLTGLITNAIPYFLPFKLSKKIKDPQFVSSIRYGSAAIVIFPIYYLLSIIIMLIFLPVKWYALVLFATSVISGRFAFFYQKWFKKNIAKFRYTILHKNKDVEELKRLRKEITTNLNTI